MSAMKQRSFILGYSATAVIKWMGKNGWALSKAQRAVKALATSPLARTSIITALNDGRSEKYQTGAAELVADEIAQLEQAAGGEAVSLESLERDKESMAQRIADLEFALEEAKKAAAKDASVVEVQLKKGEKVVKVISGLFHAQFKKVLKLAKKRKNIFLYGPTGCGKSHICEQVAEALGLRFSFVSCTSGMSEGVLGGRLLPTGDRGTFEYIISEFLTCYEEGGVFLLDEMDAADPNVLLFINAALANGKVAVSNRPKKPYAKRHPDFVCIAAANTVGTGADRLYAGRNKLDGATLDRFAIGKVYMTYDSRVEEILCPDDALRSRLTRFRRAINAHGLERAMSTRFMRDAHDMMNGETPDDSFSLEDVEEAFFKGWREDEVNKVRNYN